MSLVAADEGEQAVVLFAAGGAAFEVGAESGNRCLGVVAAKLQLDVAVELLEAFVAAEFGFAWAEQPAEGLVCVGSSH